MTLLFSKSGLIENVWVSEDTQKPDGYILQVIGPVVDIRFNAAVGTQIYNKLLVYTTDKNDNKVIIIIK